MKMVVRRLYVFVTESWIAGGWLEARVAESCVVDDLKSYLKRTKASAFGSLAVCSKIVGAKENSRVYERGQGMVCSHQKRSRKDERTQSERHVTNGTEDENAGGAACALLNSSRRN